MRNWECRFGFAALIIIFAAVLTGFGMRKTSVGMEEKKSAEDFKIIPVEFAVQKQKSGEYTEVHIGSLCLFLPKGWKLEQRQKDGVMQYILVDIHSQCEGGEIEGHREGYEHEIVITPYEVSQLQRKPRQLAGEIKKYFSVPMLWGAKGENKTARVKGCYLYGLDNDREEAEYFLFSENEAGEKELFHIMESTISSYQNDVEAFEEFMKEELVWTDMGRTKVSNNISGEDKEYYYSFHAGTDDLLVVMHSSYDENAGKILVYREDSYEAPAAELEAESLRASQIGIADINGDGYEDFLCSGWLLKPLYSLEFVEDEEFEGYLWDTKTECFVYMSGEQMLAKCGAVWEKRRYGDESAAKAGGVPEDLSGYLSGYILKSKEEIRDVMSALVSDRELTIDEVKKLAKENIDIKNELLSITANFLKDGIWIMADADNDGIEDVFLCEYLGGSLGTVDYCLFAGNEDGGYELTDRQEGIRQEFAFINWKGKNYLARTTWEFTKKLYNGISLECYDKGIYQGGVWLAIEPEKGHKARSISTSYVAKEQYRSLEGTLLEISKSYEPGSSIQPGTAETVSKDEDVYYNRSSDIDNDGSVEDYRLSLWQTTNYYTVDHLEFKAIDDENWEEMGSILYEGEGAPMNLWVDETEYGNVIFVLYEDNLYDFHISGYQILAGGINKLIQVNCHVQTCVTARINEGLRMVALH